MSEQSLTVSRERTVSAKRDSGGIAEAASHWVLRLLMVLVQEVTKERSRRGDRDLTMTLEVRASIQR